MKTKTYKYKYIVHTMSTYYRDAGKRVMWKKHDVESVTM